MPDDKDIAINPFAGSLENVLKSRKLLDEKSEEKLRSSFIEIQSALQESEKLLTEDVKLAISNIPPLELHESGSIKFESEAFAWFSNESHPYPISNQENEVLLGRRYLTSDKIRGKTKEWGEELFAPPNTSCVFSPDATMIAFTGKKKFPKYKKNAIRVFSTTKGESHEMWNFPGHELKINCIAFSPDSAMIASCSDDCSIRLWNTKTGKHVRTIRAHSNSVSSVSFSLDGTMIISCSVTNGEIKFWKVLTGEHVKTIQDCPPEKFWPSPCGNYFLTAGRKKHSQNIGFVNLSDFKTGKSVREFTPPKSGSKIHSFAYSPDGTMIAVASENASGITLDIFDVNNSNPIFTTTCSTNTVSKILFSPDCSMIGVCSMTDGSAFCNVEFLESNHWSGNNCIKYYHRLNESTGDFDFKPIRNIKCTYVVQKISRTLNQLGFELNTENGIDFTIKWETRID